MEPIGEQAVSVKPILARAARRPDRSGTHVHVIQPRRHGWWAALVEAWRYRWCVSYFGTAALLKRYRRTWLGFLWVPLKPAYNIVAKLLFFGGILGVSSGKTPYPIFFLFANAAWYLFYETALWSTRSLELARTVLKRAELPRLPIVAGAIVTGSVEFFVYSAFAMLGILYYVLRAHVFYLDLTRRSVLLPTGLFLLAMLGLGVGLVLSGFGASARDVRFSLHWGMSFLMYVTPVLYPLTKIPPQWRPLAELNPVTGAMQMVKDGLFGTRELTMSATIVTVVATLLLWVPGLWIFHRRDVLARSRAA